jgi:RNA polymerase sigma-70 factor (ECF subfamily)
MSVMTARFSHLTVAIARSAEDAPNEEHALVRAAAGGDRAAFDKLYTRYARMVHGIMLARVPPSDAEDLVQEVFLTAFRKVSALRSPEAFASWLASIARNRAAEHHRGLRQVAEAHREASTSHTAPPDGAAFEALEIIRQLPEAYRETLILRLVEGMTGPEIAERTGLTPDSVRVNLFRGMKLLRERLGGGLSR